MHAFCVLFMMLPEGTSYDSYFPCTPEGTNYDVYCPPGSIVKVYGVGYMSSKSPKYKVLDG